VNDIIQLKITLKETAPSIWRRILVDKSTNFSQLHSILINTMGWSGGHLYEFNINGFRIGEPYEDDGGWGGKIVDASKETLGANILNKKGKFMYTYDFGDDWRHEIKIEKFLEKDENVIYPICIDGEQNCPPDDCGGVWGFYDLLETIKNKKHPDHKDMLEWLGEDYDATFFDKESVNEILSNYGNRKKMKKV